jgi:N-acyl-D-aspartate/D-glutamate deacylase
MGLSDSMTGVNVIDVEHSKVLENMTVKIKDGKIASISKASALHMQEEGWASTNATGLYMCPGLIDCESRSSSAICVRSLLSRSHTCHSGTRRDGEYPCSPLRNDGILTMH